MNVKEKYFSFEGRIGRRIFWFYYVLPVMFFSALIQVSINYYEGNGLVAFLLFFVNIMLFISMMAGFVKRLHDRDKSAWWLLLVYIPVIGTIYWFIDLGLLQGVNKINKYGSPAAPNNNQDIIDA